MRQDHYLVVCRLSPVEARGPDEALHHLGGPGEVVVGEHGGPRPRAAQPACVGHHAALVDAHTPQSLV